MCVCVRAGGIEEKRLRPNEKWVSWLLGWDKGGAHKEAEADNRESGETSNWPGAGGVGLRTRGLSESFLRFGDRHPNPPPRKKDAGMGDTGFTRPISSYASLLSPPPWGAFSFLEPIQESGERLTSPETRGDPPILFLVAPACWCGTPRMSSVPGHRSPVMPRDWW